MSTPTISLHNYLSFRIKYVDGMIVHMYLSIDNYGK